MSLDGVRIAVLEARRGGELCDLIRRRGGTPLSVPAVQERWAAIGPAIAHVLDALAGCPAPVVVFSTAAGVDAVLAAAEELGRRGELEALLQRATTVCRGPKPAAALRQAGLPVSLRAADPATTMELIAGLATLELRGAPVVLVHHGERNLPLVAALTAAGAVLLELVPYAWELPADLEPMRRLVRAILAGTVDVVAFTTQVQVRHLLQVAATLGAGDALVAALRRHTLVAAVGPACAAALRACGVPPDVMPENPRMGPLVAELGRVWNLAPAKERA